MVLLDFISNELLREKVKRNGSGAYANSRFASKMGVSCGAGVTNATLADQMAVVGAGAGQGQLPARLGPPVPLTLDRLLNKIKHRNPELMNFRVQGDRHIFIVCPEHTHGGAEGVYEFDVQDFCAKCREATNAL